MDFPISIYEKTKLAVLKHFIATLEERYRAGKSSYLKNLGKELLHHWHHFYKTHNYNISYVLPSKDDERHIEKYPICRFKEHGEFMDKILSYYHNAPRIKEKFLFQVGKYKIYISTK